MKRDRVVAVMVWAFVVSAVSGMGGMMYWEYRGNRGRVAEVPSVAPAVLLWGVAGMGVVVLVTLGVVLAVVGGDRPGDSVAG